MGNSDRFTSENDATSPELLVIPTRKRADSEGDEKDSVRGRSVL